MSLQHKNAQFNELCFKPGHLPRSLKIVCIQRQILNRKKPRRLQTKCTRSKDGPLLAVVNSKCSACDRSVANMNANTWNKLPVSTQNAESIAVFKKLLKNSN